MKPGLALLGIAALALTGCNSGSDSLTEAKATDVPKALASVGAPGGPVVENEFGTPVKNRVATIGLLNKRNNLEQDLVMKSGEQRRIGNIFIKLAACEKSPPWEQPAEIGAFVQVFVEERETAGKPLAWRKIFSGWLFKNKPSLNVVEHPVYDVWVKDCAMKFPGEEEDVAASASSAAKPAGSASGAPAAPLATPSPKPSASPSAGR